MDNLETELKKHKPVLFYTIPTFQNPSGTTLPLENREKLATLSKEHNFMIVADEVYHFLYQNEPPPLAFAGLINEGNIISLGSFSKILAPGLRLGWIETSHQSINTMVHCGLLDSGGGLNPFTSALVRLIVETNELEHHIEKLRSIYKTRLEAMDKALMKFLPEVDYSKPNGGYFFWVHLPEGIDARLLLGLAEEFKVSCRTGAKFSCQNGLDSFLRLCFVYYEEDLLIEGVQRLQQALKKLT